MKCITGTEAEVDAVAAIVDKALGYPKRGTWRGSGRREDPVAVWDGRGTVPLGWANRHESVWVQDANNAVLRLEDGDVAVVTGAGSPLTGQEKAAIVSKSSSRVDLANFGARIPKAPPVVAAAARMDAAAEDEKL